ncbi:hypothetical protein L208DRAFT_1070299, partial [Tricholoma matsutake]
ILTFLKKILDEEFWVNLLKNWVLFETENPPKTRLPTKNRPGEIGVWLKNGWWLQANQMPQLKNIKDFGNHWLAWWKAIQPGWRGDELSQLIPSDPSWSQLLCGAVNGFLVVILALAWWMQGNTSSGDSDLPHLKTAVVDVSWTLVQL